MLTRNGHESSFRRRLPLTQIIENVIEAIGCGLKRDDGYYRGDHHRQLKYIVLNIESGLSSGGCR